MLLTAALSCSPFSASLRHVGQRCLGLQHYQVLYCWSLLRQGRLRARRVRVVLACEPAQLSGRGTLWSLWVASASDRCAELSPLHSFTAPFRSEMSGASALGTCVFSLARASAALCTTCACGRRASCDAALGRCMVVAFAWLVLLTAAPSCRPLSSITAPFRPDVWGFSVGYFVFSWQARASEPLICTMCACGSGVRALAQLYRYCAVVALSGECRWPLR